MAELDDKISYQANRFFDGPGAKKNKQEMLKLLEEFNKNGINFQQYERLADSERDSRDEIIKLQGALRR